MLENCPMVSNSQIGKEKKNPMIHSKNKHSVSWASWETLSIAWSTKKPKSP